LSSNVASLLSWRRPGSPSTGRYRISSRSSAVESVSWSKCGDRAEPGNLRTSTTDSTWDPWSSSVNSVSVRWECPTVKKGSLIGRLQGAVFVCGDVVGLVALDLVLRIVRGRASGVALVVEVLCVHLCHRARDTSGLRGARHMITDTEPSRHGAPFRDRTMETSWPVTTSEHSCAIPSGGCWTAS